MPTNLECLINSKIYYKSIRIGYSIAHHGVIATLRGRFPSLYPMKYPPVNNYFHCLTMLCIGYNIAIQSEEGREAQRRTTVLDFWTGIKPTKMEDKVDKIVIVFQVGLLTFKLTRPNK